MKLTRRSGTRLARGRNGLGAIVFAASVSACGAKTGLLVPPFDANAIDVLDAARDATRDVPQDTLRVCIPGQFTLTPRAADAVFVIDRSGSMDQGLSTDMRPGRGGASRWSLLESALAATLPAFVDRVDVGALFFPQAGTSMDRSCALPDIPTLDVTPQPDNAANVLAAVRAFNPAGATPTFAALHRAYTWIVRNPDRARARYLILSTDGGPNCNTMLDPTACVCTGGGGAGRCGPDGTQCLDATRAITAIHDIANNPATAVPTYVIGIAPDAEPAFASTLTAMAVAGGRPRIVPGQPPTFYSVRAAGDLATVLTGIQESIARCSFVTPSSPDDPDDIGVVLDGTALPRDTTRNDGWDWTNEAYGEITLFGAACDAAIASGHAPIATVGCRDGG